MPEGGFTREMIRQMHDHGASQVQPVDGKFVLVLADRFQGRKNRRRFARQFGTRWKLLRKQLQKNRWK